MKMNLNDLIAKTLHCHPYLRVDGGLAGNDKFTRQIEKKNNVYTSPRNIRKVFIKSSGIDIVYYRPIVGKGDGLSEILSYSVEDKELLKKALDDKMSKIMSGDYENEDEVILTGTGFSAFLKDLSLSNLEELYFDWTLLMGNMELLQAFITVNMKAESNTLVGLEYKDDVYYNEINSINKISRKYVSAKSISADNYGSGLSLAKALYEYIRKNICNIGESMESKYPRLKVIGFIANSNYQLKSFGKLSQREILNYGKYNVFNMESNLETLRRKLCGDGVFKFSLFFSTNVNLYASKFRVDPSTYQFDKDFLYDYFKCEKVAPNLTREAELTKWYTNGNATNLGLESKLWWANQLREGLLSGQKRAAQGLASISKEEELDCVPQTDYEKILNAILKKGVPEVEAQLQMLYLQMGNSEARRALEDFSPGGKKYYTALLEKAICKLKE